MLGGGLVLGQVSVVVGILVGRRLAPTTTQPAQPSQSPPQQYRVQLPTEEAAELEMFMGVLPPDQEQEPIPTGSVIGMGMT